jgi:hypothetical protein
MAFQPTGGSTYKLGASISSTDTSIRLASFTEPISNTPYTMANISSDIGYGTLSPQTASSEFISFSGITQNGDGSATLTGVIRGLSRSSPFSSSVTFKLPHSGQSIFILSDSPQEQKEFAIKRNAETIAGDWTFTGNTTFTVPPVSPSAPDASTTTKGYVKMSTAPALSTNPIAVGDNDSRVPTALVSTSAGAGDVGKTPKLNASGKIDSTMLIPTDVQVFTANGTWTKPTNAKAVRVITIGGGGAGAPGGNSVNAHASGGGGGARVINDFVESALTATVSVTVAAQSSGAGNMSSFGTYAYAFGGGTGISGSSIGAIGGAGGGSGGSGEAGNYTSNKGGFPALTTGQIGFAGAGAGGTTTTGLAAEWGGASGGGDSDSGTGGSSIFGAPGGGAGGKQNGAGSRGGQTGVITTGGGGVGGANGVQGTAGTSRSGSGICGDAGGGGGSGANGGAGGVPGAGGGAGGFNTGTGGVGARGEVIVITYF